MPDCRHSEILCDQIARWEHKLTQPTEAQSRAMVVLGRHGYYHYIRSVLGTHYTLLRLMALGEQPCPGTSSPGSD